MRDYIIMTDSCCDLSQQEVEELELTVLPLSFTIEAVSYTHLIQILWNTVAGKKLRPVFPAIRLDKIKCRPTDPLPLMLRENIQGLQDDSICSAHRQITDILIVFLEDVYKRQMHSPLRPCSCGSPAL